MRIQDVRRLLREAGAVGGLLHLSDDPSLTFGDLKDVLSRAAQGRLENVTEKLDGVNLVFTWSPSEGGLRVARTGGEIKKGGLDAEALAQRFRGRGNVLEAFKNGFDILERAIGVLPEDIQDEVFEDGRIWYSLELIYSGLKNTVSYDANNIVFHQSPVFRVLDDGTTTTVQDPKGVGILDSFIDRMQSAVAKRAWHVRGPALVRLKKISDGSIVDAAMQQINSAMSSAELDDGNTLQEYLFNMVVEEASDLGLGPEVVEGIAGRIAKVPGAPNLTQLKKMVPPEQAPVVQDFVRAESQLKKRIMRPIERAVYNFSVEVLRGLESALIADSEGEVQRLRSELNKAIGAIQASGHAGAMDVLAKEMGRLEKVENIGSPMEGIVFMYKDKAYKFTGAFTPAHQILSLFTFGRKDIPTDTFKKEGRRRHRGVLIVEGGLAFAEAGPITLEELEATWPSIEDDLETLGVTNIHPVGTTWKKSVMGDVDLAGEYEGGRDELFGMAGDMFGADKVAKVGHNIIAISYPVHGGEKSVQVDLMLGDPDYLSWARYGPSPDPEHEEFSVAKGALRNLLLNIILRFAAKEDFADEQSETDRTKYVVDFDKGLFLVRQTRIGKSGRVTKGWRTTDREFITGNPDEVVAVIFGEESGLGAADILRLEDLVQALRRSPELGHLADNIMGAFVREVGEIAQRDTKMLGPDPEGTLRILATL